VALPQRLDVFLGVKELALALLVTGQYFGQLAAAAHLTSERLGGSMESLSPKFHQNQLVRELGDISINMRSSFYSEEDKGLSLLCQSCWAAQRLAEPKKTP
jgi:hypothetical protein